MTALNETGIIEVPEHYRLISRTDLKGTILEANEEFIEISGYSADEIIGQPHNILRNQDVPKAVFKDFWETIQAGKGWTQIVKNRAKDGRAYWVKANASPIIENGQITGYISVRKPATQAEIAAATEAYQLINSGKLVINEGIIETPSKYRSQARNPYLKMSLMGKLSFFGIALLIIGTIITAVLSNTHYLQAKDENMLARYANIEETLNLKITEIQQSGLNTAIGFATLPDIVESLESGSKTNRLAKNTLSYSMPAVERMQGQKLKIHIHKPDSTSFYRSWTKKAYDDLSSFRFSINEIAQTKKPINTLELGRASIAIRSLSPIFSEDEPDKYLGSLEVVAGLNTIDDYFKKTGSHYIAVLTPNALEIASKAKKNPAFAGYHLAAKNFSSEAIEWLKEIDVQALIDNKVMSSEHHLFASYPIKDQRGTLVGYHIIIEDHRNIATMNDISKQNAINAVIKVFSGMLFVILVFLYLAYKNIAVPVRRMVKTINQSSLEGDLSTRLNSRFNDEMGQLAKAYNHQMQTMQITMGEAGRMVNDVAHGNFTTKSVIPAHGDFDVLYRNVDGAISQIDNTFSEIRNLLTHIKQGDFSYHPDIELSGEYEAAMKDAQAAMAMLRGVFHEVNQLMAQVSEGYFTRRINAEASGELQALKDSINKTLDKLQSAIQETSQVMISQGTGDLRQRIEGDLQGTLAILKDGVNNSATNMGSLLSQSNYSILKLSNGAKNIAKDIADLSARTQEQAASIEETAASMEEITSTIQSTAENARLANSAAKESIEEAHQANDVVHNTITAINEISDASEKISEITSLIDSIAFQTNLLALNAAVEAARAGEHGRGFAVVAGEVRTLAGKAADAAKDIRGLIDDTLTKVSEGASRAKASGEALSVINESITKISGFVSEISQSSEEQAKGVAEVNKAIGSIDIVTQQNSALVEETATRTEEMEHSATQVNEVINTFKIDHKQINFDEAMKTGVFTFAHARRAHRQWKGVIHAVVEGMDIEFNREAATDHTKCALGLWFYGPEGQQYAHLPEMQEVEKWHIELHATIKRILDAKDIGDLKATAKLFEDLDMISEKVIAGLTATERVINSQSQSAKQTNRIQKPATVQNKPPESSKQPVRKAEPRAVQQTVAPTAKAKPAEAAGLQTPAPSSKDSFGDGDEWGEF